MKREHKQLLINQLNNELQNLYHNASLSWADDISGFDSFFDFTMQAAEFEVQWLNEGGACGLTFYNEFEHIKEKASKFKTEAARRYFLAMKRREYIAESGEHITGYIVREYGAVYSYGRGGRTLAPENWIASTGRGFNPVQYEAEDISAEKAAVMLQDVRLFNSWVKSWCNFAPDNYKISAREFFLENTFENKRGLHDTNKRALQLIKEIKAARRSFTPAICEALTDKLMRYIDARREYARQLKIADNGLKLCC